MRISPSERQAIATAARETLWPGTRVALFGSRVDDAARGGDIDLLVTPPSAPEPADWVARRQRFVARLYRLLDERRIDVVLDTNTDAAPLAAPVLSAARRQAVELVQT
jgi:predicted nucleotidyltransferase